MGELSSNEIKTPGDADVSAPARTSLKIRLVDGSDADCRAGIFLAREAHRCTIFRDIAFSEDKARAIFHKATGQPARFALIYAVPNTEVPLTEERLYCYGALYAST